MNPGESLLLLGCLCTLTVWWFLWAINHSCTPDPEPCERCRPDEPSEHHWTLDDVISHRPISVDENAWETEADEHSRPLRDTEKAILRAWQDMPYDIDADGGI